MIATDWWKLPESDQGYFTLSFYGDSICLRIVIL